MKSNISFGLSKKKTPFQKHKELEEEKKRKADEEAAKLYEEFVNDFSGTAPGRGGGGGGGGYHGGGGGSRASGPPAQAFVRGGTVMPGQSPHEAPVPESGSTPGGVSSTRKPATKYVPSFMPSSMLDAKPKAFDDNDESVFPMPTKKPDRDKGRNIDKVLEQLKKEQQEREARKDLRPGDEGYIPPGGYGGGAASGYNNYNGPGVGDSGDPYTTNLYLGNLAPDVDEEILKREFGRFGALGSVKVMWPRDEEQRAKQRNCGFIAFMKREDAEKAMYGLNGVMLHHVEMRIGWGKPVPLPAVPLYVPGIGTSSGALPAASTRPPIAGLIVPVKPWESGEGDRDLHKGVGPDLEVQIPEDSRVRFIIDSTALYVMQDGCAFEQLLMESEVKSPEYAFLFDLKSAEHAYYRWRLYSLAEGDTLRTWRVEPFVMVRGGCRWLPPPMTAITTSVGPLTAAQKGERERERQLLDMERDRFEDMLRSITVERSAVCDAMMFALDNADAASEVVDILAQALSIPETPVPLKVARLFLVSDILHNSTAPVRNASRYRTRLESVLPEMFESLQATYRALDSRMIQEVLRKHVLRVLRVWRERYLFNDDYLNGLQATFLAAAMSAASAAAEADAAAVSAASAAQPDVKVEDSTLVSIKTEAAEPSGDAAPVAEGTAPDAPHLNQQADGQQQNGSGGSSGNQQSQLKAALAAAAVANPALAAELLALGDEELERRCRQFGLVSRGSAEEKAHRLLVLDAYLHGEARPKRENGGGGGGGGGSIAGWAAAGGVGAGHGPTDPSAAGGGGSEAIFEGEAEGVKVEPSGEGGDASVLPPSSRWTSVDEDEEKQQLPQVPISKWLLQEQEAEAAAQAQAQQAAAAAHAAALQRQRDDAKIFSDEDSDMEAEDNAAGRRGVEAEPASSSNPLPAAGASGVGVVLSAAALEERRQRLREVELQVASLEADLEDDGLDPAEVQRRVDEKRKALLASLEASLDEAAEKRERAERRRLAREAEAAAERADDGRTDGEAAGSRGATAASSRRGERGSVEKGSRADKDRERERSRSRERVDRERGAGVREGEERRDSRGREREAVASGSGRERERDRADVGGGGGSRERGRERERDTERGEREDRDRERDAVSKLGREREREREGKGSKRSRSPDRADGRRRRGATGSRSRSRSPGRGGASRGSKSEKKSKRRD